MSSRELPRATTETEFPLFTLVAGEASGDQLGAALIIELRQRFAGARFAGIGGRQMRAAGMETWWDSEELAVFGLFEVVGHLSRLWRLRRALAAKLVSAQPAVFIGIDAPDFNLGLETQLRACGIRTVHYVSPTVWAWRPGRVKKIARAADKVLCLFPFEPGFYQDQPVTAHYVGHPMADQVPLATDTVEARQSLGIEAGGPVIALLPGSRTGEVTRLAPPMIEAASRLALLLPGVRFIAAMANDRVAEVFGSALAKQPAASITLVPGRPRTVIAAADLVVCASGTATLETMLINRPMIVVYRIAPATYYLIRSLKLVKSAFFSLPNILAGELLVPELFQQQVTPERLVDEVLSLLQDDRRREQLRQRFEDLHRSLRCQASVRAADAVSALVRAAA